jgi:DNA-binding NtrC family response regulator
MQEPAIANSERKHSLGTVHGRILIVDDEANARSALAELLREEGYEVETAADAFKALGKMAAFSPHLVLTDLKMPGMDGIELIGKLGEAGQSPAVVVMTAYGAIDTAVEAMRAGAADYLTKPVHFDELLLVTSRVLERQRLQAETDELKARVKKRVGNMVGESVPIRRVFDTVEQVAPSRATVLITGESGTGKELVAEAIHQRSPRANGPFIKLHCAALAETLLESELFGHERGAFTGAIARKDGRFHLADRGTLFLDEIGEVSPAIQVKLLRFLQEHEFERVGGTQTHKVDVRIIAATNQDLKERVARGMFREDLYYRLNVVEIHMPPLRDRGSDILLLADHFLRHYARENDKQILGFTETALTRIRSYDWPGNVRELENAIERAVVMAKHSLVEPSELPAQISENNGTGGVPVIPGSSLADIERYAILQTLEASGGSTSRAADVLGISVRKIQYKLQQYRAAPKSNVAAVAEVPLEP